MPVVADLQALVVDVEAVAVFHAELAPAQQAGPRPGLVSELPLDLIDDQRQILVAAVQVLDQQGEQLFMRRSQHHVGAAPVFQAEHVVAVVGPTARDLVRLARQERREVHLLEPFAIHLFANDSFHVAEHDPTQRQPGESARGSPTDVAAADEQPMAGDLGIDGVLTEGADEESREAEHRAWRLPGLFPAPGRYTRSVLEFTEPKAWAHPVHAFLSDGPQVRPTPPPPTVTRTGGSPP